MTRPRHAGRAARPRHARWARATVRMYPQSWRERYGAEFQQLLLDELADGRWTSWWWWNIAWHALVARFAGACDSRASSEERHAGRLGRRLGAGVAGCLLGGMAMWSQLAVGWQWSAPGSAPTRVGAELISVGLLGLGLVAAALVTARAAATLRAVRAGARLPALPAALALASTSLLVAGSGWVGLSWPGTGGHAWAQRALVPAWLARRAWASTLWLSSFWAHPRQLLALGAMHVAWMLLCPALMLTVAFSWRLMSAAVRPATAPPWLIVSAAAAGSLSMLLVSFGAAEWALQGAAGPGRLFASGTLDLVLLALTAGTALACLQITRRLLLDRWRAAGPG